MSQEYIKLKDNSQDGWSVEVEALLASIRITTTSSIRREIDAHISYDDARKLVEMLVKHTHPGHSIEPVAPKSESKLAVISGDYSGLKTTSFAADLEHATRLARKIKEDTPDRSVWLAELIKSFQRPLPKYEWKDL